jgi:clan AA aspartic protease (TIGR02281 family)
MKSAVKIEIRCVAAILFASTALALASAATAAERNSCKLMLIEEWPVRADHYRPVIDGSINGQKIGILLDTGAISSLIRRAAVAKLGLKTSPVTGYRIFGIGGETRAESAYIDEFRIGAAVRKDWPALVAGEDEFAQDVALLLGDDFFRQLDVEFALAGKAVRLFQAKECDRVSLGYWATDTMAVPLEAREKIHVSVFINGQPMLALLDSGASLSTLSLEAARQLGVTPDVPGVVAGGCIRGMGKERLDSWIAPFQSLAIGDELIRNPKIRFAPLWQHARFDETGSHLRRRVSGLPDMVLGSDFLHAHRVLIANSQRKIYFSYTGGTVFPETPGKPCSADKK